jgi:hypothetical protein
LTVNVILDPAPPINKIAKGLLSSLSVCAAVILALRSGQSRRIAAIQQEREERREEREARRLPQNVISKLPESYRNFPKVTDWRKLPQGERAKVATMTTAEVMLEYDLIEKTARNWRKRAINQNGHKSIHNEVMDDGT